MNEETLFHGALEKPPHERAAYLDRACAGDTELRRRIDVLLKAHTNPESFLQRPALAAAGATPAEPTQALDAETPSRGGDCQTRTEPSPSNHDDLAFLKPSARPDALGRLDHYDVLQIVGKGGFGIVLKGFDTRLHRVVAIKVLSPAYAAVGSARSRFIREARAAAAIKNEHIVGIYDVQEDAIPPYLVMELIDGISLQDKLDKHGALGLKEILRIGLQAAGGLAAAHAQGIMHRDIKPANILLENGVERVKITDFGLARSVDDASLTQSGTVAGTPRYMSPEQAEGSPIDHRSDLFSLGTVLYAMCTGHPPFRASGTHAVLKRVIDASPRPIREINNEIPDWLCDIIAKLHAKQPEDRFQTAKEVAELLGARLADVQAGRVVNPPAASASEHSPAVLSSATPILGHAKESVAGFATGLLLFAAFLVPAFLVIYFGLPPLQEATGLSLGALLVAGAVVLVTAAAALGLAATRLAPGGTPRRRFNGIALVCVVAALGLGVAWLRGLGRGERLEQVTIAPTSEPGWVHLFNGKDVGGWQTHPDQPGDWKVKDGILIGSGPLSHLFKPVGFDNFHLSVVAQINEGGAGTITFHVPEVALPIDKCPIGHRVEINCLKGFPVNTGSLTIVGEPGQIVPSALAPPKPGEWFNLDIMVNRGATSIYVNGQKSAQFVDTAKRTRGRYLALQAGGPPTVIQFKKIDIKELPPEEPGWVRLFNGKDLAGWHQAEVHNDGEWTVGGGVLTGKAATGRLSALYSDRVDFENFHLRTEVRTENSHGDVVFRTSPAADVQGYTVAVMGFASPLRTGAVTAWAKKPLRYLPVLPGEAKLADRWVTLEVIANGSTIETRLDGTIVTRTTDASFRRGHLALVVPGFEVEGGPREGPKILQFRKIEIKELPASDAPEAAPPLAVAPFDAKKAKEHQDAWAKHLGVEPEITNSIGMKMRLIPPGEFTMGSDTKEIDWLIKHAPDLKDAEDWVKSSVRGEGPERRVTIGEPFRLGAHEVMVGQFREFVKATKYVTEAEKSGGGSTWNDDLKKWEQHPENIWNSPKHSGSETHPVVFMAAADARAFCAWLSEREGVRYALPTEEQWEYACRAGTVTRWYFGDDDAEMKKHGWTVPHSGGKHQPVGRLAANPFGLFDVHGNVTELTVTPQDAIIERGGQANETPQRARSAWRILYGTHSRRGFRVAIVGDLKAKAPPLAVAPFDGKKAKEHQDAWAKHLGVEPEITNSIGMKLRLIPPGKFLMGSLDNELGRDNDETQHDVAITRPFYLGRHEVTIGQFKAFVNERKYQTEAETGGGAYRQVPEPKLEPDANWRKPFFEQTDEHPVVCISKKDALAFCEWLSAKEGKKYVLPAEAQWEYACRAGAQTRFHFGEDEEQLGEYAWYFANSENKTHQVGGKKPNAWGLYDMHGNVQEWTADWYAADYYRRSPPEDPPGAGAAGSRVMRGGSWCDLVRICRAARRYGDSGAADRYNSVGFRIALVGALKAKTPPQKAWTPLFNSKDLKGWTGDINAWKVENEALVPDPKAAPWLQTQGGHYKNFAVRFDCWVEPKPAMAGFHLYLHRTDDNKSDAQYALLSFSQNGAGGWDLRRPKGIVDKTSYRAQDTSFKPSQWNLIEVRSMDGRIEVYSNGKSVGVIEAPGAKAGYIAIHPISGEWIFRKFEIKELP